MTTSPESSEHRRSEARLEIEATIFIEVIAGHESTDGDVIMCNSLDLSANGLQVVVDEDIEPESIFRLCVDLPDEEPIFLVGEVKWRRPDPDSDAYRIGFLLFESEDSDILRWKTTVARLLAEPSS